MALRRPAHRHGANEPSKRATPRRRGRVRLRLAQHHARAAEACLDAGHLRLALWRARAALLCDPAFLPALEAHLEALKTLGRLGPALAVHARIHARGQGDGHAIVDNAVEAAATCRALGLDTEATRWLELAAAHAPHLLRKALARPEYGLLRARRPSGATHSGHVPDGQESYA